MQLIGECQEPVQNNGIIKVLISDHSGKQPQQVWFNVLKENFEFETGKIYRITIEQEK
jgi:hypothetical protein